MAMETTPLQTSAYHGLCISWPHSVDLEGKLRNYTSSGIYMCVRMREAVWSPHTRSFPSASAEACAYRGLRIRKRVGTSERPSSRDVTCDSSQAESLRTSSPVPRPHDFPVWVRD